MKEDFSQQRDQARELYFNSDLYQAQIAEKVGVSAKTISLWVNDGQWNTLKESYRQTPIFIISQMNEELQKLNKRIATRDVENQVATVEEAEIRRKIIYSINGIKERQSPGAHIEMLVELFDFIKVQSLDDAKLLNKYAGEYMVAKLAAERRNISQPIL